MSDPAPLSDATPKLKYPKQVFFIFANEFSERFCYYGLRALLVLFVRNKLLQTESNSKIIFHMFSALAYAFPLLGAIIADSWFGKFRTILYFSIVYILGTLTLTASSFEYSLTAALAVANVALILIAIGTGGIKPCVSSFGGDQFTLPQQQKHLDTFFYIFYFCINLGSFLSTMITPLLRDLECLEQRNCYPLGFGLPAILMVVALMFFVSGKPFYIMVSLEINVVAHWIKCIFGGIKGKFKSQNKPPHWLDHSEEKFGKVFVQEVKETLQILIIFLLIPFFWALFDQQGSGWTLQANLMDGKIGDKFSILPEQMVALNTILILILLPTFSWGIYPLCAKCKLLTTPLQRMGCGGVLAGFGFFIAAVISLLLEAEAPVLPTNGQSHLRIYNLLKCTPVIDVPPYITNLTVDTMDYEKLEVKVKGKNVVDYQIDGCQQFDNTSGKTFVVREKESSGYFLSSRGLIYFKDDLTKHLEGLPKIRTLVDIVSPNLTLTYRSEKSKVLSVKTCDYSLHTINEGTYTLENFENQVTFSRGGVYTILVSMDHEVISDVKVYEVTKANSLHILWQFPQYFLLTTGEVLLSPTGLEFAYTQAPKSMKSVMTAMWLLTVTGGNVLVVLIELVAFSKQSSQFFLYGGLMLLDMVVFMFLARRYKYVTQKSHDKEEPNTSSKTN